MISLQEDTGCQAASEDVQTLESVPGDHGGVATIPTLSEAPDESLDSLPDSLGFVMRCRTFQWWLFERVQAIPCWIVSISLHIAAGLVLATITVGANKRNTDDLVLDVSIRQKEPAVINLAHIRDVFEPQSVENPIVVPMVPTVKSPPLLDDAQEQIEEAFDLEVNVEIIPDESFLNEPAGDLTEDIASSIGTEVLGLGTDTHGDGGGEFNPRGVGDYGSVLQHLARRLWNNSKKLGNNVLLIWLVDRSISMNDDQEAIREQLWEMDRRFRERGANGKLKQAVVSFADQAELVLKPAEKVEEVMAAFDQIKPVPPNTPEKAMSAIIQCAKLFSNVTGMQKAIVLVDDDSGDDPDKTEAALSALRAQRITLYVINRESPFQEVEGCENYSYTDEKGVSYHGTGTVRRGPETAMLEVPALEWGAWNWPTNWGQSQVMSGFGIHDQSLLAFHTGGAYYILNQQGNGQTASPDYDWERMERYRPELLSRSEYLERVKGNPFRKAVEDVEKAWNDRSLEIKTRRWAPDQLDRNLQVCEARIRLAENLIAMMEGRAILPSARLETLKTGHRWPANADLVLAQLYLARYRVRQYLYALTDFQRRVSEVPKDHLLVWEYNLQPRRTAEETTDRDGCINAFQRVVDRHPGTPWASVAAAFDPNSTRYLHGYRIRHKADDLPFMALIEFKDGSQIEAKVLRLADDKVTYQTGKGIRTVPKDTIARITPINKNDSLERPRI